MNTHQAKYDSRINPVYQVSYSQEANGKRLAATKQKVRWIFGFSNRPAIEQGHTGVHCRGEEHEIVLVWSVMSGKRLVTADGEEVHFSSSKRTESKFETSWTMNGGGHILKIIAHATPPLFAGPGFRQFELFLDGHSFHDMPKIYELGQPSSCVPGAAGVASLNKNLTVRSPARDDSTTRTESVTDMGSFTESMPVTPEYTARNDVFIRQESAPVFPCSHGVVSPMESPHTASLPNFALAASAVAPTHQTIPQWTLPQEPPNPDQFADEFAPTPSAPLTYQDKSEAILSAYAPALPSVPALAYTPYYTEEAYQTGNVDATFPEEEQRPVQVSPSATVLKPTMEPISVAEMEPRDQPPSDEVDRALKALVNLEDITETLETPEQAKTLRRKHQDNPFCSKPLPPTNPEWHLGLKPSLRDIQQHSTPKKIPTKEIMRTHAFDPAAAQAGMLVVYGDTTSGSSTLSPSQGFGVHPSHYGSYTVQQQQQQQQPLYAAY